MVSQQDNCEVPLNPVAMFGKESAADEVRVIWCSSGRLPPDVSDVAADWLQAFVETTNQILVAMHRRADGWWLLRVDPEPNPDMYGRRRGLVLLGRLTTDLAPERVPPLLLQFGRVRVSRGNPPHGAPLGDRVPGERTTAAARAALALALGHTAAVKPVSEAVAVLARTGLERLNWVALCPMELPRLPLGPGLAITAQPTAPPAEVGALMPPDPDRVFALPLDRMPPAESSDSRLLIRAGLAGGGAEAVLSELRLDRENVEWLIAAGLTREVLLRRLPGPAVGEWLNRSARPEDLPVLADRLTAAHRAAVSDLLRGRSTAAREYLVYYPHDRAGAAALLPEDLAAVRDALLHPERPLPAGADVDRLLHECDGWLVPDPGLVPAARASASGSRRGRELLLAALARQGVPTDAARYLLGGDAPSVLPPMPTQPPRADWLIAFDPHRWLEAVRALPGWHRWLIEGVRELRAANRLTSAAVLDAGIATRDPYLLGVAEAPPTVVTLADPRGGTVRLPPSGLWPRAANNLLAELMSTGTLSARLDPNTNWDSLLTWLAGLTTREDDVFAQVARFLHSLREGKAASCRGLDWIVPYLSRRTVLRQVVAWAEQRAHPDRGVTLRRLLCSSRLKSAEQGWLTARTLECVPLPPLPPWTAEEMADLFPLLDPVRDVIRVVLSRSESEPGEDSLLKLVLATLSRSPVEPPGAFPASARRHPMWVESLVGVPGWSRCADPDVLLSQIRQLCQEFHIATEGAVAGDSELRNAIRTLAK